MTDSGMRPTDFIEGIDIRPDFHAAIYDGRVFQIDPKGGSVERRLISGLRSANGVAFGPDHKLYANESLTGWIYRLDPFASVTRAEPLVQTLQTQFAERFVGPDGMAFDADGLLYCAIYCTGIITVNDPRGALLRRIPCGGQLPTNIPFHPFEPRLLVTEGEHGCLESHAIGVLGQALHRPRPSR